MLRDPPEFLKVRREAHERFLTLPFEPNPLYRGYGYFSGVDLTGVDPQAAGPAIPLPPPLPGAIRIVHDASGTRLELPGALATAGVALQPLAEVWSRAGSAIHEFLRGSEDPTDKLSALAIAALNRGYRLDIPDECRARSGSRTSRRCRSRTRRSPSAARSARGRGSSCSSREEVFSTPDGHAGQRLYASSVDLDLGRGVQGGLPQRPRAGPSGRLGLPARPRRPAPRSRLAWVWNGPRRLPHEGAQPQPTLSGNGSAVDDLQTFFGTGRTSRTTPRSTSRTSGPTPTDSSITRGVFRDQSRGMSRGLVRIENDARKTLSYPLGARDAALARARAPTRSRSSRSSAGTSRRRTRPRSPRSTRRRSSTSSPAGCPGAEAIRMIGEGFLSYVLDRAPIAGLRELHVPVPRGPLGRARTSRGRDGPFPSSPRSSVTGTEAVARVAVRREDALSRGHVSPLDPRMPEDARPLTATSTSWSDPLRADLAETGGAGDRTLRRDGPSTRRACETAQRPPRGDARSLLDRAGPRSPGGARWRGEPRVRDHARR